MPISLGAAARQRLQLLFVGRATAAVPAAELADALAILADGEAPYDALVTHKLPLDGAARAYHAAEAGVAAARPCLAAVVAPEPEKKHRAAVWAELD